jgi:hypothetical protein
MKLVSLFSVVLMAGCATTPEVTCPTCPTLPTCTTTETTPTETTPTGTETVINGLVQEEIDALATWTSRPVLITPVEGGPSFLADSLTIAYSAGALFELDVVTTVKAQDHNSSRSNKTNTVAFSDPLGDDDTNTTGTDEDLLTARWDGAPACTALPCPSNGRPDGASSRLVVVPNGALADGRLSMTWGETTDIAEDFGGSTSVGSVIAHRGHVTVLKAAATDDGDIVVSSALDVATVTLLDGDEVVYEGPVQAGSPLAFVEGTTGASWPRGFAVESSAIGTEISFTW